MSTSVFFVKKISPRGNFLSPNRYYRTEIYSKIKAAISSANKHLEKIKNTLNTNYNNGKIKGINNKIKVIKRVSYGYRSFDNFRLRVFLCFYHKKIYGLIPKT